MNNFNKKTLAIAGVAILTLILVLTICFESVDDGHVGVRYNKWAGKVDPNPIPQGKWNWTGIQSTIYEYNTRLRNRNTVMEAQSENGLPIKMNITVRYRVDANMVASIFQEVTREDNDIADDFIIPELSSIARDVIRQYTDEEIYKGDRAKIQGAMFNDLQSKMAEIGVVIDAVLLREVKLPKSQMLAIEKKQKANQELQTTEYKLKIAEQEALKRVIDAEGQAKANMIIQRSITPTLINYEQIKAYKELSKSNNAKIIISGGGNQPFIINPN